MRILLGLTDPRFGGPQRSSLQVAEVLHQRGIETQFCVPEGDGNFPEIAREKGFTVHQPSVSRILPLRQVIHNAKYLTDLPSDILKVKRIIEDEDIDILTARTTTSFHLVGASIVCDVPLVWHFNDTILPYPLSFFVSKIANRWANEIIVSADNVTQHYFSETSDVTKIYPTVDTEEFHPSLSDQTSNSLKETKETIVIGLVGNINPLKGYDTFLRAFTDVCDEYDNVISRIVGRKLSTQKEYFNNLLRIIRRNDMRDSVEFLGWEEDIVEFLSEIDIFVMPSNSETGPMTLMEAMAMEKPIVTTRVGVVPEQLVNGSHAIITDPKNEEQMVCSIKYLIDNRSKWAELGENARELAEEKFSVSAAAHRYYQVYSELSNS